MLFKKSERRCRPWVKLALGALAVAGAVSITNRTKDWVRSKLHSFGKFFKKDEKDEECEFD